jgi:hypothetical protein
MRETMESARPLGGTAFTEADDLLRSMGVDWRDAIPNGNGRNSSGAGRS